MLNDFIVVREDIRDNLSLLNRRLIVRTIIDSSPSNQTDNKPG
jgi:hypothetical protein